MPQKQPFGIVDFVLIVVIIALTGLLVYIIYKPSAELARQENLKWESRARMTHLRTAELQYYHRNKDYLADIDSILIFIRDSLSAEQRDSLFPRLYTGPFVIDSLRHSPRSLQPYIIMVDDTSSKVPRYRIEDPDGYGYISSLEDPTEHNKASWEQ
ncbi:MAG: hypothetical protein GXO82_00355 [Chlorobi bacterium]|nr:hypothetical protein [Chlorobiota bacterium]